jgi:SurA N-terminal domain
MIGTIRKHQQWLWYFIIAAMVIGLVAYFNPTSRYSGGQGVFSSSAPDLGSINGEPITPEQLKAAMREGRLFFRLRSGAWPDPEDRNKQLQSWAEQSLVLQSLMKDYKITATTDAAARFTKEQLFGVPPGQSMPLDMFNDWVQNDLMRKGGLTLDDLDRFARHQAGQEYLISLFGMTGKLITPKEVEFTYRRENEPMVAEVISFPTTNFYSATAPAETDLQEFFTKHEAEYRVPDRLQVNYVVFDPSNYLVKADQLLGTNLDDKIDEYYHRQGADSFKDESGQPLNSTNAEAKIKNQMRMGAAMQVAKKDAYDFLNALAEGHDDTHPYAPSDLAKLAQTKGFTVKTTEPFDRKNGCKDLDLEPKKALDLLFSLQEDAADDPEKSKLYFPFPLTNSASALVVAGLQKRFPSQLQTLAAVRDQVVKDYRDSKAQALAKDAGDKFAGALQAGLMQGKSFDAVCAAQGVKPETLPTFALTTTNVPPGFDKSTFQHLQEMVFTLAVGQSSKFMETPEGGLVAYVKERLPVDAARMEKELPFYLARMREQRQLVAFQEWFTRQLQLRLIPPPGEQNSPG